MRDGDLVRFLHSNLDKPIWKVGLLVEYRSWEKIARIWCEGKMHSVRPDFVQLHKRGSPSELANDPVGR